ncbi:MAG: hypothetical protein ACRBDL_04445 [Alphaproteobacteria bacterium]
MDEIQTRLQETSQNCLAAYNEWVGQKQDSKAQEGLGSAIHELRKVSSRLEIELAISERDQMTSKPLPIPAHRANNKKGNGAPADASDNGDGQPIIQKAGGKRRRTPRKPQKPEGSGE